MDFFNLESSSEEEPAEQISQPEAVKSKWDWDQPENFGLYFSFKPHHSKRKLSGDNCSAPRKKDDRAKIEKLSEHSFNLSGHKSSVNKITWSKKTLHHLLSCSFDSNVILWNLKDLSVKKFDMHTKLVRSISFSLYETSFFTASFDQTSCLTDLETSQILSKYCHADILTSVCAHPKDEHLALLGSKNEILLWDTRTSKISKKYKAKSYLGLIQDILFLDDTQFVSSGDVLSRDSAEYSILVWDFDSTAILSNQIFHEKYVCTHLRKHPFSNLFYGQTHGNYIAEFSSRSPFKMNKKKKFKSTGHVTEGYSIGFDLNSSGCLIASGSTKGSVCIYNSNSGGLIKKIEYPHKEAIKPMSLDVSFKKRLDEEVLAVSYSNVN
ncbi:WD repeat-containing 25 [Brachionus plicatilis]|uniref:WD repeat-containing 25 n=1 Tax=Brachionus plicatilis TaxID=10195 RepID=A0A3M7RM64_BRAPC|nr:WD repeat-containing 25 [Brachionus plicatilis]